VLGDYKEMLRIYLPVQEAEYYKDTHIGISGDGDTDIILNLTEEEAALLEEDIATNIYWSKVPLSAEDCSILYGAEYCDVDVETGSVGGLLEPNIKRLSEGYYCIYDKNTYQYSMPQSNLYNFIFVQYDVANKTLYLEEHDD